GSSRSVPLSGGSPSAGEGYHVSSTVPSAVIVARPMPYAPEAMESFAVMCPTLPAAGDHLCGVVSACGRPAEPGPPGPTPSWSPAPPAGADRAPDRLRRAIPAGRRRAHDRLPVDAGDPPHRMA